MTDSASSTAPRYAYEGAALLAAVTWSLAGVWIKWLPGVSLLGIVSGRLAISLPAIALVVALGRGRPTAELRTAAPWGLGAILVLYYAVAVSAFRLGAVAEVTLLLNTSPLFVALAAPALGMKVRATEWFGMALATARSPRTSARCCGCRASARRRERSGVRRSTDRRTTTCCAAW